MPPRPPTLPTTYQYKSNDQPDKVAQQLGVTPQQLIQANPGGYPFSTGQTIKIPQIGPQLPAGNLGLTPSQAQSIPKATSFNNPHPFVPQKGSVPTTQAQTADSMRLNGLSNLVIQGQFASGIPPKMVPAGTNVINPMTGVAMTPEDYAAGGYTFDAASNSWRHNWKSSGLAQLAPPAQSSDSLQKGDFYGYVYNPDTGQNERVIKNTSTSSFYNEKRWDPSAKGGKGDFVRIGDLIRQGKLDEKTGKAPVNKAYPNGKPNGGNGNSAAQATKPAQAQGNANVNSVLNFNLGSG